MFSYFYSYCPLCICEMNFGLWPFTDSKFTYGLGARNLLFFFNLRFSFKQPFLFLEQFSVASNLCFCPELMFGCSNNVRLQARQKGKRAKGHKGKRAKGHKGTRVTGPQGNRAKGVFFWLLIYFYFYFFIWFFLYYDFCQLRHSSTGTCAFCLCCPTEKAREAR